MAEASRHLAEHTADAPGEAAAYGRVMAALAGRPCRQPLLAGAVVGGLLTAGAVALVLFIGDQRISPSPTNSRPADQTVHLGPASLALAAGKTEILGEATVGLSLGSAASAHTTGGKTEIALGTGSIDLHVTPRRDGRTFAVGAGPYRFVVLGTVFRVNREPGGVDLWVEEGRVAVWRGTERLAIVGAEGHWRGLVDVDPPRPAGTPAAPITSIPVRKVKMMPIAPLSNAPIRVDAKAATPGPHVPLRAETVAAAMAPAAHASSAAARRVAPSSMAPPTITVPCSEMATSGRTQDALACYQKSAAGDGLAAETALYEVARLRRDILGDPQGALAVLRSHRERFSAGALRAEVDLSIVELLPQLGRHRDALDESARILASGAVVARATELHLLRGNIYREALHDCTRAETEYAAAAAAIGREADEASFLRGVCLETLGQVDRARAAYRAYLTRPQVRRAAEARTRLEHLP